MMMVVHEIRVSELCEALRTLSYILSACSEISFYLFMLAILGPFDSLLTEERLRR